MLSKLIQMSLGGIKSGLNSSSLLPESIVSSNFFGRTYSSNPKNPLLTTSGPGCLLNECGQYYNHTSCCRTLSYGGCTRIDPVNEDVAPVVLKTESVKETRMEKMNAIIAGIQAQTAALIQLINNDVETTDNITEK